MTEFADLVQKIEPHPKKVSDYVAKHARRGDPASVLATMDRYAREERFLMNLGPDKGALVEEVFDRLPENARILEVGAYCGYSAVLFASKLGPEGRLVSLEIGEESVEAARANVEFAGLADKVEIILGPSGESIPSLEGTFDLVFLDHWKDLYKDDLQAIEAKGLLAPGSLVVADNVGESFNPTAYLEYVRTCGHYESEHRESTIEYHTLPDAVEISVFRPSSGA
ncbi:MAG: class I SAM-dependent methyltransferase [bacterium]|nr:class I SAM-dependent methyltransferase [bacterium]